MAASNHLSELKVANNRGQKYSRATIEGIEHIHSFLSKQRPKKRRRGNSDDITYKIDPKTCLEELGQEIERNKKLGFQFFRRNVTF